MPADEKPKKQPPAPAAKPTARPATAAPVKTAAGTGSRPAVKKPGPPVPGDDDDEVTVIEPGQGTPRRSTTVTQVPVVKSAPARVPAAPADKPPPPVPTGLTPVQRLQMDSGFLDGVKDRQRRAILGATTQPIRLDDLMASRPSAPPRTFTGEAPADSVSDVSSWKAVVAPVQSRPGQRSRALLEQVLKQFAVASNARYQADAQGKSRGHLFVADVSRAMGCEIPRYVGAQELSLGQTVNWLRHEGPMRGWLRTPEFDVIDKVNEGCLVVAVPRDVKVRALAIVVPEEPADDGKPLLAGACGTRGYGLHPTEALGVRLVDYFHHP